MTDSKRGFHGKYLSLTTYKRDGSAVATPVWFVEQGGRLLVQTDVGSGKVKRIRANPEVSLAPCSGMGHLRGEQTKGHAEIMDASESAQIERLVKRKYHWDMLLIGPLRWAQKALHVGKDRGPTVCLAITPDVFN